MVFIAKERKQAQIKDIKKQIRFDFQDLIIPNIRKEIPFRRRFR